MPFTLRLAFHCVRSAWVALLIFLVGWVALVPATEDEIAAIGAVSDIERPLGLMQLRVARAMVHIAPDRAARAISRASDGEISPELAGMLLRDIADGAAVRAANDAVVFDEPVGVEPRRGSTGAKFIQAQP